MTVVVDASVVVAALLATDAYGVWAEDSLERGPLVAPHLLPVEVLSQLRRSVAAGLLAPENVAMAVADLADLPIRYVSAQRHLGRIWELRSNVTPYDAWYVALAEALDAPLVTLDRRLARASGPRCAFVTP